jgi:carboxyl-terminal processing protease
MKGTKFIWRTLSYLLVAMLASMLTMALIGRQGSAKLTQLYSVIEGRYIGEADMTAVEDAAADAMVAATGDRWSYYMTAQEYADSQQQKKNVYVGIGITVSLREDQKGIDILKVESEGPAYAAGIRAGDILIAAAGQDVTGMDVTSAGDLIRGEVGTTVEISVLRGEETLHFTVTREIIDMAVAVGTLLPGNVGLVTIENFNSKCASESKAAVEELIAQGATAIIFDVRNNPGGYLSELIALLDYLLPEGDLLKSVHYTGIEEVDRSNADCLEMPMAVLINGNSYSAAEFFAAALQEYDWAVLVGEPTTGKGYYQQVIKLKDGSAVNLSTGKYFTPNGVSLTEVGGLRPEIAVSVDEETAAKIYAGILNPEEDPQIQAAVKALTEN